jgi:response regulator NasT
MLRVLIVDESRSRAAEHCAELALAGYQVAAVLPSVTELPAQVAEIRPDIILVETESPSRDTLEHLAMLDRTLPRPVIIFAEESETETVRAAMRAGVVAYVVDGLEARRLKPVIEVAMAQFETQQALREERDVAKAKLAERITLDKAKGILMKVRGIDEAEAFALLRKQAMNSGRKIGDVAQAIIDSASLLL